MLAGADFYSEVQNSLFLPIGGRNHRQDSLNRRMERRPSWVGMSALEEYRNGKAKGVHKSKY